MREEMMSLRSIVVTLSLATVLPDQPPAAAVAGAPDLPEALQAARGVAPSLCLLATDGIGNGWGGGWGAPVMPLGTSDVRGRVRSLHRSGLTPDERRAFVTGLAAVDPCERQVAATVLGRAG